MNEQQRVEHNRVFKEASAIVEREVLVHERMVMPKPGWWLRRKLKRAISLLERAVAMNPENWSAMWMIGKVHQRLSDISTALSWFERSCRINPSQPDVAREASLCAMDIGRNDDAIAFALRATQAEPANAGLHANLALAYLLAARLAEAKTSIDHSLSIDPADTISKTIAAVTKHFTVNGGRPPTTTTALREYLRKNRTS